MKCGKCAELGTSAPCEICEHERNKRGTKVMDRFDKYFRAEYRLHSEPTLELPDDIYGGEPECDFICNSQKPHQYICYGMDHCRLTNEKHRSN